jgi:hypothetical protein
MPFDGPSSQREEKYWDAFFEKLEPIVKKNEYDCSRVRFDGKLISQSIMENIQNSDLCIAILTDLNPNVFYELGVRHTLRDKTLLLLENGHDIPFDNHEVNIMLYDSPLNTSFNKYLSERIRQISVSEGIINDSPVHLMLPATKSFSIFPNDRKGYITYTENITNAGFSFPKIFDYFLEEIFMVAPNNHHVLSIPSDPRDWKQCSFYHLVNSLRKSKNRKVNILLSNFFDECKYNYVKESYNSMCPDFNSKAENIKKAVNKYDDYIADVFGAEYIPQIKRQLTIKAIDKYYFESLCFVDGSLPTGKMYFILHFEQVPATEKPAFFIEKITNETLFNKFYNSYHINLWEYKGPQMKVVWPIMR